MDYKPAGYNSVSPYFVATDPQRFIDLLIGIFNAKELRRYDRPDGSLMHAEMQIDDSVIMLGGASEEYPANQLLVHVYVPDAKATFKKAIELGCEALEEPKSKENDPDLRGMFRDYLDNIWAVATQTKED